VATPEQHESFVDRVSRMGEEALGKIAEELISNPVINASIARAFDAREKAIQAQDAAMGALNLPSAADIERVTRRIRSVSQRLEGIEDAIDRLDERLAGAASSASESDRLGRIESRLDEITRDIAALAQLLAPGGEPVPRAQERLTVTDS
jgi:chromosome segregation ATPase